MDQRFGEKEQTYFRCDRFYHTAQGWWCSTREHTELGPYISEKEAEAELFLYIRKVNMYGGMGENSVPFH